MNECEHAGMCPNGECVNVAGSYKCQCNPGYKQSPNQQICIGKLLFHLRYFWAVATICQWPFKVKSLTLGAVWTNGRIPCKYQLIYTHLFRYLLFFPRPLASVLPSGNIQNYLDLIRFKKNCHLENHL